MNPRHLSPSALEAFEWCALHRYAPSYRDGVRMAPNLNVWYGSALHSGIEAAYRKQDWELTFTREWRRLYGEVEAQAARDAAGGPFIIQDRAVLAERGLFLIQSALDLGLVGEPEWEFTARVPGLDVPLKGRVDLLDRGAHVITDWKSTQRGWSAAMVAKKVWQPAIYSLVYHQEYAVWPTFQYVILPVVGAGPAYVLPAVRTPESHAAALVRAQAILVRIRADDWGDCTCPPSWRPKKEAA